MPHCIRKMLAWHNSIYRRWCPRSPDRCEASPPGKEANTRRRRLTRLSGLPAHRRRCTRSPAKRSASRERLDGDSTVLANSRNQLIHAVDAIGNHNQRFTQGDGVAQAFMTHGFVRDSVDIRHV